MTDGFLPLCPIIDVHAHYGYFNGIYFPSPLEDGMLQSMDRCGVKLALISSHASLVEPVRGNKLTRRVVDRNPGRFLGYWTINPHYPDLYESELDSFEACRGFVGFKFHPDGHRYPLTGAGYEKALRYADAHKKIILVHTWGFSPNDGPGVVERVASQYPNVKLIMGHSGYGQWDGAVKAALNCPNIYLDLCAAGSVAGVIETLCSEVGSHRVLFGTDLPWFDPHFLIGCISFSHISEDDKRNIFCRNAEKLLAEHL